MVPSPHRKISITDLVLLQRAIPDVRYRKDSRLDICISKNISSMCDLLHPFADLPEQYRNSIIELYQSTFTGCDELPVSVFLTREVYGVFIGGILMAFVAFRGPLLEYLAVNIMERGKGVGSVVVYAALSWCRRKMYRRMYLECKENLIAYYKRFGGVEIEDDKRVKYNG